MDRVRRTLYAAKRALATNTRSPHGTRGPYRNLAEQRATAATREIPAIAALRLLTMARFTPLGMPGVAVTVPRALSRTVPMATVLGAVM